MSGKRTTKPRDPNSTAYMRGWRDAGKGNSLRNNPYDPGYMRDKYKEGWEDRKRTLAGSLRWV